jgi:ubiquinone/menaquinone biosynthesis C-methylase UbiE
MEHYTKISYSYDNNFFYSNEEYNQWIIDKIKNIIEQNVSYNILDIGSGTCKFSSLLEKNLQTNKFVCVEPCCEMLEKCDNKKIIKINGDLLEYVQDNSNNDFFDLILMKEMIHHIDVKNYLIIFDKLL